MKEEEIYEDISKEIDIAIKKQKIAIGIRELYPNISNERLLKVLGEFLDNLKALDEIYKEKREALKRLQEDNENHIPKID